METKKTKKENSALSKVLKVEMAGTKHNQKNLSEAIQKQSQQLWTTIRNNKVKFNLIVKICNIIGLEIVIRNKSKNCEYIINKQD